MSPLVRFKAQNHPQQSAKPSVDDRATVPEVFGPLNERFRFTVDVAAAAHNTKCDRYYSIEDDGLAQSWAAERVWCNPPYSNIRPWVEKAWTHWGWHAEWPERAKLIVMLLPANRTEQAWWQELVEPHLRSRRADFHCEFIAGRIRFLMPGETEIPPNSRPPFGSCLLIWENPA